jgi:hypothetical protein
LDKSIIIELVGLIISNVCVLCFDTVSASSYQLNEAERVVASSPSRLPLEAEHEPTMVAENRPNPGFGAALSSTSFYGWPKKQSNLARRKCMPARLLD